MNTDRKTKILTVGDKLRSESSWNELVVSIIDVTETEAISDHKFRFNRSFSNGDTYINKDMGAFLDYLFWQFIENN